MKRSLEFYSRLIGLQPVGNVNGGAALSATGRSPLLLHLTEIQGGIPKPAGTTGLYHTAILFPTRHALGNVLNRLIGDHYPLQGASDHGVSEAVYFADPDGLGVELYVDRPKEEWPRRGGELEMVSEPLDIDSLLAAGGARNSEAIDPATVIGHLHLHVADLMAAEQFFNRVLGFAVTQRNYPGARFLAAGDYHHHIGVNTWAGKAVPPANASGLASFTVAIPEYSVASFLTHVKSSHVSHLDEGNDRGITLHGPDGVIVHVVPS
jgi:catechol 2,3-dioxygenase